jgi:hypothetical protein
MNAFSITLLQARSPDRGHFWHYHPEAGLDLFGTWLFEATFGISEPPVGPSAMPPPMKPKPAAPRPPRGLARPMRCALSSTQVGVTHRTGTIARVPGPARSPGRLCCNMMLRVVVLMSL